ncbi:MAG: four helix bundle protein [Bacteroidales bacterium]
MKYSFENLEVWQMSRELVNDIYQVTSTFPQDEKSGLTSQLRRASISVSSNIAEGSTRWSKKDQSRFYENQLTTLRGKIDQIGRMLNALYQSTHQPINLSTHQPINP